MPAQVSHESPHRSIRRHRRGRRNGHQQKRRHIRIVVLLRFQFQHARPLRHHLHLPPGEPLGEGRIVRDPLQERIVGRRLFLKLIEIRLELGPLVHDLPILIRRRNQQAHRDEPDADANQRNGKPPARRRRLRLRYGLTFFNDNRRPFHLRRHGIPRQSDRWFFSHHSLFIGRPWRGTEVFLSKRKTDRTESIRLLRVSGRGPASGHFENRRVNFAGDLTWDCFRCGIVESYWPTSFCT